MATGNLFLGTARRKLGDVVFYRRNGVQQSRVRVRTISNPKSEGQALQRAYFAPVSKFYSPLASVLETSWEGLNRLKSYNAFQSAALRDARANGWYVPKAEGFVPLPYQISRGTLPVIQCSFSNSSELLVRAYYDISDTVASASEYFIAAGAQEGDQVTFIACVDIGEGQFVPSWCRFFIDTTDTRIFSEVAVTPFFSVHPFVRSGSPSTQLVIDGVDYQVIAGAVILSRWDATRQMWLRSSSWMVCEEEFMLSYLGADARSRAIRSYQDATRVTTSEVYLNGSGVSDITATLYQAGDLSSTGRYMTIESVEIFGLYSNGQLTPFFGVVGHDISDGEKVRAAVFNNEENVFLRSSSQWYAGSVEPEAGLLVQVTSETDPIWVWLQNHGVTVPFTPSGTQSSGTQSTSDTQSNNSRSSKSKRQEAKS